MSNPTGGNPNCACGNWKRRRPRRATPKRCTKRGNLAAELAEQAELVLPRLIVDDATSEKLGMMLAEQGGRIASMSPEGGVFDLMAGLYSKSGIPQFGVYLMGHSGDDLITDRVSRKSVRVERAALTCAYAMQPTVIEGLAENPAFRGRVCWRAFCTRSRKAGSAGGKSRLRQFLRRCGQRIAEPCGRWPTWKANKCLQLAADASAALREWEAEIEAMLGDGGQMEIMRDWGAKLAGATRHDWRPCCTVLSMARLDKSTRRLLGTPSKSRATSFPMPKRC